MQYIGIDPGQTSSRLCILTADGELIERRVKTSREQFDTWLGRRAPARLLTESSTESEWAARHPEGIGHEVIVAGPNFAPMYATRSRRVKTDEHDARTLREACRLGSYRRAHRTSEAQRQVRRLLVVREALARTRANYITTIKTLVRAEGLRVPASEARRFTERLAAPPLPEHLSAVISPPVTLLTELNRQIAEAARRLEEVAEHDPVVERPRTAPGVGVVTAVTFVATLDGAGRFETAKQVRSYPGLAPNEKSNGERQCRGRITKADDGRLRALPVEAGRCLLRSKQVGATAIQDWARKLAGRRGKCAAAVALARKLAGILFAMWRDGTDHDSLRGLGEEGEGYESNGCRRF